MPWHIIPSDSDPRRRYLVFVPNETETGRAQCDCTAFAMCRGPEKTCKHITRVQEKKESQCPNL